jgi:multimeric flavodoxin WrbA
MSKERIMLVCAVNGSPNEKGNTDFLISTVLEEVEDHGIDTVKYNMNNVVRTLKTPFCTACNVCNGSCYRGSLLENLYEDMKKSDVIIIGSPVYFGGPTAQTKILFDKSRAYRKDCAFVGKYGAGISCGGSKYGGQEATLKALHDMMLVEGMSVIGDGAVGFDAGHHGVCAHRPAMEDEFAIKRCHILAQRIISLKG